MAAGVPASKHGQDAFVLSVVAETEISVMGDSFVVAKRQSTFFFFFRRITIEVVDPQARCWDNDFLGRGAIPGSSASCLPNSFVITEFPVVSLFLLHLSGVISIIFNHSLN